ncbi:MAG: ATP phosphoribosyltransferase regulatory subunit [Gammaproteobacteria bacterium]|nr:MAG: ATP phosphoribosyltransferase regulatory subunit [Gammaproteobacteria bacterium]
MTSKVRWSLPDGVDELLAPKALEVEKLRRKLIDLYVASNYEFIIPPLLELSETLGGEAHDEISSYAFSFLDDLTGKKLSIRPDISEQASRIDAYRIASKDVIRLCYAGDVVKKRTSKVLRSRTTIQVGAEIFGDSSIESDLESINLMIKSLQEVGLKDITLSLGHAGFTAAVMSLFQDLNDSAFSQLEEALTRKSKSDISSIIPSDHKDLNLIMDLCDMYGSGDIIEEAKEIFKELGNEVIGYLEHLTEIVNALDLDQSIKVHIDIGEVQGFKYHNGIVFSAYSGSAGYALAKGGRYDGLRKADDDDRPAIGFDLDLIAVSNIKEQ